MEKNKMDKLTAALEEAGYELTRFEEEAFRRNPQLESAEKTGDILLKISPAETNRLEIGLEYPGKKQ